jgi:sigma-B regulation protein RsbU (phosphoserine phosphatase)
MPTNATMSETKTNDERPRERVVVIDDVEENLFAIARTLERYGYEVETSRDGEEGWETIANGDARLAVSDWSMPRLDGVELCERIRAADLDRYVYIILLTAKNERGDLLRGLEAGADDFVSKPFDPAELAARVRAGERVVNLQREIDEKNRALGEHNERLERDLRAAADLQKSMLPKDLERSEGLRFVSRFIPSSFVAGDVFNYFTIDERRVGFYLLDVSGHGVSAAMLSFTISKRLSSASSRKAGAAEADVLTLRDPAKTLAELNDLFYDDDPDSSQYFTMIYGVIDCANDRLVVASAGHPPMIRTREDGAPELFRQESFPIGLFEGVRYEATEFDFRPSDRLYVYSDGVSDLFAEENGEGFEELRDFFERQKTDDPLDVFVELERELTRRNGGGAFEDDVSAMAIAKEARGSEYL